MRRLAQTADRVRTGAACGSQPTPVCARGRPSERSRPPHRPLPATPAAHPLNHAPCSPLARTAARQPVAPHMPQLPPSCHPAARSCRRVAHRPPCQDVAEVCVLQGVRHIAQRVGRHLRRVAPKALRRQLHLRGEMGGRGEPRERGESRIVSYVCVCVCACACAEGARQVSDVGCGRCGCTSARAQGSATHAGWRRHPAPSGGAIQGS